MFEHLIAAEKPSWNRRALIIISLAVHAAVVVVLVVISIFHVEELPRPGMRIILVPDVPPPPPPGAPRGRAVEPKAKGPRLVVQPREIAKLEQPPRPEEPVADEESDRGGEARYAVPGGVPFGEGDDRPAPKPRIQLDESNVKLKKISGPDPEYTQQAQEHEIEGPMLIKCVITEDGAVRDCRVLKTQPFMDRAAVEALEQRRYEPYVSDGKRTEVDYTFKIMLKLPH
jgi:protein TonB